MAGAGDDTQQAAQALQPFAPTEPEGIEKGGKGEGQQNQSQANRLERQGPADTLQQEAAEMTAEVTRQSPALGSGQSRKATCSEERCQQETEHSMSEAGKAFALQEPPGPTQEKQGQQITSEPEALQEHIGTVGADRAQPIGHAAAAGVIVGGIGGAE